MNYFVQKFSKIILFIFLPFALLVGMYVLFDQNKITDKAQAAAGLVGYWNFDETSGTTAADSSGNNNIGTLINGPVWTAGKYGNALSFDGTNDYINIGSLNGLDTTQSITLEAWVNFNNIDDPAERYIIGSRPISAGSDTISLAGMNGGMRIFTQNQGRGVSFFGAVSNNTWNHIVGVREVNGTNETLKLYVNGVLKGTNTYTSLSIIPNYWAIGRLGGTAAYYYKGLIDEVKIYNRALTAAEVLAEYSGGSPIPTPSVTPTPTPSITPTPTPTIVPTPTPSVTPTPTPIPGGNVPINNVTVSAIKTDSVNIAWDSTSAGTSIIEYGTTVSYGSQTTEDGLAYFHTQTIAGLTAGTLYHYRIHTKDYTGAETVSGDYTFTTRTQTQLDAVTRAARADGQLPKIYYVSPIGNDANDGLSSTTSFQHPSFAANKTDAGDTVYLMDGTWTNEHIIFPKTGIDVAPITLTAINKGGAILDGLDNTVGVIGGKFNVGITVSDISSNFTHNYINVSNLKITNYYIGINVREAHHINISDTEIYNVTGSALFLIDDNNF